MRVGLFDVSEVVEDDLVEFGTGAEVGFHELLCGGASCCCPSDRHVRRKNQSDSLGYRRREVRFAGAQGTS